MRLPPSEVMVVMDRLHFVDTHDLKDLGAYHVASRVGIFTGEVHRGEVVLPDLAVDLE